MIWNDLLKAGESIGQGSGTLFEERDRGSTRVYILYEQIAVDIPFDELTYGD